MAKILMMILASTLISCEQDKVQYIDQLDVRVPICDEGAARVQEKCSEPIDDVGTCEYSYDNRYSPCGEYILTENDKIAEKVFLEVFKRKPTQNDLDNFSEFVKYEGIQKAIFILLQNHPLDLGLIEFNRFHHTDYKFSDIDYRSLATIKSIDFSSLERSEIINRKLDLHAFLYEFQNFIYSKDNSVDIKTFYTKVLTSGFNQNIPPGELVDEKYLWDFEFSNPFRSRSAARFVIKNNLPYANQNENRVNSYGLQIMFLKFFGNNELVIDYDQIWELYSENHNYTNRLESFFRDDDNLYSFYTNWSLFLFKDSEKTISLKLSPNDGSVKYLEQISLIVQENILEP